MERADRRQEMFEAFERQVEVPMICLALLFIPVLIIPWVFELPDAWDAAFITANGVIWVAFALELVIKTYLAPSRLKYLRGHWFDVLIVVVPFFRPLRVARAARALRLLQLTRVGAAGARLGHSIRVVFEGHGLHYVLAVSILLILASAAAVTAFERDSDGNIRHFGDGLWWAVTTVTTVGYGDRFPVTVEGRVIAAFLMILGISLFSFVTANIASFLSSQTRSDDPTLHDVMEELRGLRALIGETKRQ